MLPSPVDQLVKSTGLEYLGSLKLMLRLHIHGLTHGRDTDECPYHVLVDRFMFVSHPFHVRHGLQGQICPCRLFWDSQNNWHGQMSVSNPHRVLITSVSRPYHVRVSFGLSVSWSCHIRIACVLSVSYPSVVRVMFGYIRVSSGIDLWHDRLLSVNIVRITSGCEFGWNLGSCPPWTTIEWCACRIRVCVNIPLKPPRNKCISC